VGPAPPAVAPTRPPYRSSRQRPSDRHPRHPLDRAHRESRASLTRPLWLMEDGLVPLRPLAEGRCLESRSGRLAAASGYEGLAGLVAALRGEHDGPSAPARGGSHRGDPAAQVLGRRRGGYRTTIHLRCEPGGTPLGFLRMSGERHEQPVRPLVLERGAVTRPGPGRPRIRPERVAGDTGESRPSGRCSLRGRQIGVVIPTKDDEPPDATLTARRTASAPSSSGASTAASSGDGSPPAPRSGRPPPSRC
jgi:hypothetical protein